MKKRAPEYQKERGERQEKRIVASLTESPKTPQQLADALFLGLCNVCLYLRRMRKAGRVHIASHEKRHGRPAPVWAAGSAPDAEYVPKRHPTPVQTVAERLAQVELLLKSGHTARELSEKLYVTRGRAQRYVRILRESDLGANRAVYIVGWRHPGHRGDLAPVYKIGAGKDVPKPRQTRAERYQKEKSDAEKHERMLQKQRVRHHINKARKQQQTWFAALPGAQHALGNKEAA